MRRASGPLLILFSVGCGGETSPADVGNAENPPAGRDAQSTSGATDGSAGGASAGDSSSAAHDAARPYEGGAASSDTGAPCPELQPPFDPPDRIADLPGVVYIGATPTGWLMKALEEAGARGSTFGAWWLGRSSAVPTQILGGPELHLRAGGRWGWVVNSFLPPIESALDLEDGGATIDLDLSANPFGYFTASSAGVVFQNVARSHLYRYETPASSEQVVTELPLFRGASMLGADNSFVYALLSGEGPHEIMRAPVGGGALTSVVVLGSESCCYGDELALGGGRVYLVRRAEPESEVIAVDLAARTFATVAHKALASPPLIAASDDSAYWVDFDESGIEIIVRRRHCGGDPVTLAEAPGIAALEADDRGVYWAIGDGVYEIQQ